MEFPRDVALGMLLLWKGSVDEPVIILVTSVGDEGCHVLWTDWGELMGPYKYKGTLSTQHDFRVLWSPVAPSGEAP